MFLKKQLKINEYFRHWHDKLCNRDLWLRYFCQRTEYFAAFIDVQRSMIQPPDIYLMKQGTSETLFFLGQRFLYLIYRTLFLDISFWLK